MIALLTNMILYTGCSNSNVSLSNSSPTLPEVNETSIAAAIEQSAMEDGGYRFANAEFESQFSVYATYYISLLIKSKVLFQKIQMWKWRYNQKTVLKRRSRIKYETIGLSHFIQLFAAVPEGILLPCRSRCAETCWHLRSCTQDSPYLLTVSCREIGKRGHHYHPIEG